MKTVISEQLIKLLKNYNVDANGPSSGDIYGITDLNDCQYLLTVCSANHQLQHDPTLLFSSSFTKLGNFFISAKKDSSSLILQEDQLAVTCYDGEVKLFVLTSENNEPTETEFKQFEESELFEHFILARVCFSFPISCPNKTADVKNLVSSRKETVSSSSSFFKSRQFNLLIQNKSKDSVHFVDGSKKEENKEIGVLFGGSSKRKKTYFDSITFDFFESKTTGPPSAPIVQISYNKVKYLQTSLYGQVVTYIPKSLSLCKVGHLLSNSVVQHLQLAEFWLVKQLSDPKVLSPLLSYPTKQFSVGHLMTLIYPKDSDESLLKEYRLQIHKAFLFSTESPIITKLNKYNFYGDSTETVRILINPHQALPPSGVGTTSIVKGFYGYHHYMQDNFDDNKWGCAYRSLQTLISWFRMQGYTDVPIPSHAKIQQILVDMKDKPKSFVGSKDWIGSTEVGYVLESILNVSSKFIFVNSGSDLESKGRELSMHFEYGGTPIMIGGGVLAHTILGVDWNSETGDIKFLILDPHYTGGEDLQTIIKHGWCGWKGPDFWKTNSYYNLCLPQVPKVI